MISAPYLSNFAIYVCKRAVKLANYVSVFHVPESPRFSRIINSVCLNCIIFISESAKNRNFKRIKWTVACDSEQNSLQILHIATLLI